MAEVKYNTCDIKGCKNKATNLNVALQVIFHTEQTEGGSSSPCLDMTKIDLCDDCLSKILVDHKYVHAMGG